MAIPDRKEAMDAFNKNGRGINIYNAVDRAFSTVKSSLPQRAKWKRKATFRHVLWEEIVDQLLQHEYEDTKFRPVFHNDTASFVVDDKILFRLKHADLSLTTKNFPTGNALAFDDHTVDLYGFSGIQRIELCYVLNEFETDLAWVGFAARSNGQHLWKIELNRGGAIDHTEQPDLFDYDTDASKLVRIKAPSIEIEKEKLFRDNHER